MEEENEKIIESPFGRGDQWQFNACVGQNGGPYNYLDYAQGYFRAAHSISEKIIAEKGMYIDTLIYPLLYSYRHALELSLKHFLRNMGSVTTGHRLDELWVRVRDRIISLAGADQQPVDILVAAVQNFSSLDPKGEVPRYPEDREGNLYMQGLRIINIIPIYETMKQCESAVDFLAYLEANE